MDDLGDLDGTRVTWPIDTPTRPRDVTVLAADDQDAFLIVVREVVRRTPGFTLTAEARSGEEAIALVAERHPDVVLMDARMPGVGGVEAARIIAAAHAETVVVLISVDDVDALPRAARSCGAVGILRKLDLRPDTLLEVWRLHRPE